MLDGMKNFAAFEFSGCPLSARTLCRTVNLVSLHVTKLPAIHAISSEGA